MSTSPGIIATHAGLATLGFTAYMLDPTDMVKQLGALLPIIWFTIQILESMGRNIPAIRAALLFLAFWRKKSLAEVAEEDQENQQDHPDQFRVEAGDNHDDHPTD